MKIKTIGNKIRIEVGEPSVGGLDTSSMPTAVECGEVLEVGPNVAIDLKKGDKVLYKSWGVDIVNYEGKRYHFIDLDTKAVCALIK